MGALIVGLFQKFITGLGVALAAAIALLPKSPFAMPDKGPLNDYLGYINWFVPVSQMVSILGLWVSAIATWYIVQLVMRWVKAVE